MIVGVGAPIEGQLTDPPVGISSIVDFTPAHAPVMPGGLKAGDYLLAVGTMVSQSAAGGVGMEDAVEAGWTTTHASFASGGLGYSWGFVHREALLDSTDYPTLRIDRLAYLAPGDVTYCGFLIACRHVDLTIVGGGAPYGSLVHTTGNPCPAATPTYSTSTDRQILFSHAIHLNRTEEPTMFTDGVFDFVASQLPILSDGVPHSLAVTVAPSNGSTYDGPQWEASAGNVSVRKAAFVDSFVLPPPRQQAIIV